MEDLNKLAVHANDFELRREKYALPDLFAKTGSDDPEVYAFPAIRQPPKFAEPAECTWAFMRECEVDVLRQRRSLEAVKVLLDRKLGHGYPKGVPRLIAVELLYTGAKFSRASSYDSPQTGALLSMMYLTLQYFNSCHRITAEDVYYYFKELICFHSLDFSPSHRLVYGPEEAHRVLSFFCKVFLRHLPLIRLLGLPNFELAIDTTIPPFPVFKKKKRDKSSPKLDKKSQGSLKSPQKGKKKGGGKGKKAKK